MVDSNVITEEEAQAYQLKYIQTFMGLSEEESRNLVAILSQATPREHILSRTIRGGGSAQYIPGHRFIERFNDAFGFLWSFEVKDILHEGNEIIAHGRWSLQIPGRSITRTRPDGTEETVRFDGFSIIKEQFGSAEIKRWASEDQKGSHKKGDVMDLGNDYKAAATDAMKKCGTTLGMFLDVYGARESGEMAGPSATQLQSFHLRAKAVGKSEEEADTWATERLGKSLKEATGQEVLGLVADLIDMAKKAGG